MTEPQPVGLLVRAKRLTSLARQAREGAEAIQDHTRTETALDKIDAALRELEAAVKLESKLVKSGVTSASGLDLTKAPKDLQGHIASVGRPSPQLLTARANDAAKAARALSDSATTAWATWSQARLNALPIDRMARLGFERRGVELRVESLKRIAGAPPTADNVDTFLESYEAVSSRLAKVTPEGPLDALLAKLPCHLDELTDDELRLLRVEHPDIGAQIVLRVE
jgi:hypothetical protein